jgi:preprotein translocase subunit SecA
MALAYPPAQFAQAAAGTPYPERADRKDGRLDGALVGAWGRVSPHLLSALERCRLGRFVQGVERREQPLTGLTDRQLRGAADDLRARFVPARVGETEIATAFALAREAARRHRGLRHFPVQLLGGAVMMRGALAEMQTGEGKTLTALLPAVAAALLGRPVHVITVNDYLARRDAEELAPVYNALGLSVGLVQQGQMPQDRQRAYACDVAYCTNKELVFDYLRDRLALGSRRARSHLLLDELIRTSPAGRTRGLLLRGLHFAIVDEADSVLIDEARTPLILSGPGEDLADDAEHYATALDIARRLRQGEDFHVLANERSVRLTVDGARLVREAAPGLAGLWGMRRAREEMVRQALAALHVFRRDVQYIVAGGKVQIVDEFTGRVMPDRSWELGMHQLIEAKEGCEISARHQTLARITYQQFFRRYQHLCGMTGTALEAAGELRAVYGLRVVRVPTNRPLRRTDGGARMFRESQRKWSAVVGSAKAALNQGRAVLIGTRSVDDSEHVAGLLRQAGLDPAILNARQDRQEAEIVAGAGQPGRITVATNMAGRGTDIGLHPAVLKAGGLHVILTEFHESRRIDRQLFGRAGRQGDPGSFESIVALDDELFRRFAGKALLEVVGKGVRRADEVSRLIGWVLRSWSQSAAERLNARTRRGALREGRRLSKLLGFAGIER